MGKRADKLRKKKKQQRLAAQQKPPAPPKPPTEVPSTTPGDEQPIKKKIIKRLGKIVAGILVVIGLVGGIFYPKQIKDYFFTSKKEKWENETFIRGIFIPGVLGNSNRDLIVVYGNNEITLPIVDLIREGVPFKLNDVTFGPSKMDNPFSLLLKIDVNRLYIAAIFKDIQKEEIVGEIQYKTWTLLKSNIFDYQETDTSLKVIDRGGNIIFYLQYLNSNKILLKGYCFVHDVIVVVNDQIKSFALARKNEALREIEKMTFDINNNR